MNPEVLQILETISFNLSLLTQELEKPDLKLVYRRPNCPIDEIVSMYHNKLPSLQRVEILTETRKNHISARWAQVVGESKFDKAKGLEWFDWFFSQVAASPFLMGKLPGKSGNAFRCTLDFLMTPEKFARVIEGFYVRRSA